jgi:hypothetical protein
MARIELASVVRTMIGIHHNENITYILDKSKISFLIRKIYLLFTNNKIGFIQVEILSSNLDEGAVRRLGYVFSKITSHQPKLSYQRKLSKDISETITISFKQLIENIVALQSYVPISIYEDRILPYMQINIVGCCETETKYMFFDSIQALSQRASTKNIDKSRLYIGREEYISRFVGDRIVCIYGDTSICGESNKAFLTDVGNGLIKTASENYTTVYAFLVAIRLLLLRAQKEDRDFRYLLDAPIYLSDEDNIREFFEECIWNTGWNLKEKIKILREKGYCLQIEDIKYKTEAQGRELMAHGETLRKILDGVDLVHKDVNFLVSFMNKELKSYLEREKYLFNQAKDSDNDQSIGSFVQDISAHIDQKTIGSGDEIIEQEMKKLSGLFGDKWQYVLPTSQTSLTTSGVLLRKCSDINVPNFDWSCVCICATAALEAELKRIFFDGLLDYMVSKYGEPCNGNAHEIYQNWPEALLSIPKYQFFKNRDGILKKVNHFTMGNLPFLFGETGKLSQKLSIRKNQLVQSELMRKRMTEYLSTIVLDYYREIPFETFYIGEDTGDRFTCQTGCFVWKCEQIRNKYRNKAAHLNVMTEEEASSCYRSVITKPDTYIYNAEIAGAMLELFSKIDGSKLNKTLNGKICNG